MTNTSSPAKERGYGSDAQYRRRVRRTPPVSAVGCRECFDKPMDGDQHCDGCMTAWREYTVYLDDARGVAHSDWWISSDKKELVR